MKKRIILSTCALATFSIVMLTSAKSTDAFDAEIRNDYLSVTELISFDVDGRNSTTTTTEETTTTTTEETTTTTTSGDSDIEF